MPQAPVGFELSVSARDDGTLEAVYIRFQEGKPSRTGEIIDDVLMADYGARGNLLGIEILAPVKLSDITRLVDQSHRASFRKFVKSSAPDEFLVPSDVPSVTSR